MKEDAMSLARFVFKNERSVAEQEESWTNVLWHVYSLCNDAANEKDAKTVLPRETKKNLKRAVRKWSSRTGLEKLAIAEISNDKRQRRSDATETVLKYQYLYRKKPEPERVELIRQASEKISRTSRFFSRQLASASKMEDQVVTEQKSS